MDATNNIATDLFYKVRSRFSGLKLGAETGEITINPEQARFFDFDYTEGQNSIGHVSISLAEPNSMKVYFSNGITEAMDDGQKTNWYGFLKELRQFAKRQPAVAYHRKTQWHRPATWRHSGGTKRPIHPTAAAWW
jgi:hypothetical protein